ncbi:MAG TPA: sigma-70 family RNA polymerase sigma factor [Chloroflexota bacterium]
MGIAAAAVVADRQAEVVDAATQGDARAFAALYDAHVERVYRHVYYRVGNRADAEDLTQQVFLQAWRAIGRYRRTGAPFLAWLFAIAHNAVAGFYRGLKDAAPLDFEPEVRDRWADPEGAALAGHDRAAVRRAILRLKPEQQQVVIMRFVEGLDHAAVAAALGTSEGNVRVIQHRALRELRRLLAHRVAP